MQDPFNYFGTSSIEMSDVPPPQFASYPRGQATSHYGTIEQLWALYEGYSGLNQVFVLNIVITFGMNFLMRGQPFTTILGGLIGTGIVIAALTYPMNRKIGIGKNWPLANAVIASILMGFNSALCCGVIGYIVMQQLAANEIKKYGVKRGFLNYYKKDVEAVVLQMQQAAPSTNPPPPYA